MSKKAIKIIYWVLFILSVLILPLNFGLGLVAFAVMLLPLMLLHGMIGVKIDSLENNKTLLMVSAICPLMFALLRPDGVHAITDNGLSSVLDLIGINAGFDRDYENQFSIASLAVLLLQLVVDLRLNQLRKRHERKKN